MKYCSYMILSIVMTAILACSDSGGSEPEKLNSHSIPITIPKTLEQNESMSNALQTVDHEKAYLRGFTGKDFYVKTRTPHMTQFECSSCHKESFSHLGKTEGRSQLMHLDIPEAHAAKHIMNCATCHNMNDMDVLRLNNNEKVSFNQSYKLCMQCHFQQGKDWVGGAHGKRLQTWRGKRIIMNCTDCHNPHKPEFDQRAPLGRPVIPRTQMLQE